MEDEATGIRGLHEDLHFVRQAVARRERTVGRPHSVYWLWAAYVLVGYSLIDFAPAASPWFFAAGGVGCGVLSGVLARRWAGRVGEYDRINARRRSLHFGGGIVLSLFFAFALAAVIPPLRGPAAAQVGVVMIGLVYFLGGVHYDRNLLWLGPVLMAGGMAVGLVPRYGWTGLGVVIAAGLVVPTLLPSRPAGSPHPSEDEGVGRES